MSATPHDTCIEQLRVACACNPLFHRSLLAWFNEFAVYACLRCRTVTCTRSVGDDGRFTGNAWQVHYTVGLSDGALHWLAQLPRIKVDHGGARTLWPMSAELVRYPTLYYPADARCSTPADLERLETLLIAEQAGRTVGECLRATCRVATPPPPELSSTLRGYDDLWAALQLDEAADLQELIAHAQPGRLGCALATDLLLRRSDAFDVMINALQSDDRAQRWAAFSMARDMQPADTRLADVLIDILTGLSCQRSISNPGQVESHARFEWILLLAAESGVSTPKLLATLRAVMRKVARYDASLVDYLRIVIRELEPRPPAS